MTTLQIEVGDLHFNARWEAAAPQTIEAIRRMLDQSGGFGTLLVNTQDWATREQTKHSYELLARYVAPHFNGALDSRNESQQWVAANKASFAAQAKEAAKAVRR